MPKLFSRHVEDFCQCNCHVYYCHCHRHHGFCCSFRAWGELAWASGVRMGRGGLTFLTPKSSRLSWKGAWHPSGHPPPSGIPVASREHVDIKVVLCMALCPRQDLAIHQAVAVLFGIEACLHTFSPHNMFSSLTFLPILHPKHA